MTPAETIDDLYSEPNEGQETLRETPEEPTKQTQARTYGDKNLDLPPELQNALLSLLQQAEREDLYQRRIEVMRDRRNRFYERGMQHVYEDMRYPGVFTQASPGGWAPTPDGGQTQCGQFLNDYNIFGRALQIIIAKLTENPPGVDFQPDSGNSSVDEQAAQAAEAYRLLYDRRNNTKDLLTAIVRMMGLSGRTVTWTRTVADAQQWGTDEDGLPRKVQFTTVYGTLESKVPILAKCLEGCPYIILTEDPHLFQAKMEHPEFADKIDQQGEQGTADTQFERLARIGALQGNTASFQVTDSYAWYVERKFVFFRRAMFMDKCLDSQYAEPDPQWRQRHETEHVDENGLPIPWTLRNALIEAFPDGSQPTFIGEQYVASRNVSVDDELAIDFPYAGDGMSRLAIMDPAVPIQDDFNDDMNNYHEVKVTGWPSTWINEDVNDLAAINDQVAAPYAFRALKSRPPRDGRMEYQFYREPDPNIPASFMQHTEYMATQLLQFILAIPSAVQGAGMPDQKTASGYNAALQQALGQLGVIWGAVQRLTAKVYRQAALAASRCETEDKTLVIPSPKGSVTLHVSDLGKGHFLAHPDVDSGYPESTVQKRATLSMLFDFASKNPMIAEALFSSPDNWDFFSRSFGLSELTFPEAVARRKQLAEIEVLLQQAPMGPTPEEMEAATAQYSTATEAATTQGLPGPPPPDPMSMLKSSIQPQELDYHDWEFEACREFLSDYTKVQQQLNAGNQAGIENVRLHAMEHQQYIQQQAQAQMQQQLAVAAATHPKPAEKPEEKPTEQPQTTVQ